MQKIKLIWDFNGVDSLKTAKHFNIHLEEFLDIKKAVMHGNIWKIRRRLIHEIQRGWLDDRDAPNASPLSIEFVNILLAHYSGWDYARHRKILRYVAHCIDDDFIRKISSWSIRWQVKANLNDHFSRGQMRSKMWMIDQLNVCLETDYLDLIPFNLIWQIQVSSHSHPIFLESLEQQLTLMVKFGCLALVLTMPENMIQLQENPHNLILG